jgi:hypothetical protein
MFRKIQKINKYIEVDYFKDIISMYNIEDLKDNIISNYNFVFVIEFKSKKNILFSGNIFRNNKICLMYSILMFLCFTDFCSNFTIYDEIV